MYLPRTRSMACSISSFKEQTVEPLLSKDQQHIAVGMEGTIAPAPEGVSRSSQLRVYATQHKAKNCRVVMAAMQLEPKSVHLAARLAKATVNMQV